MVEAATWVDPQHVGGRPFEREGFQLIQQCVAPSLILDLRNNLERPDAPSRLEDCPTAVLGALRQSGLVKIVQSLCGPNSRLVRAAAFAKSANANWFVPWHQDRTIAVRARQEIGGFSKWTVKKDIPHTEAPIELLSRMLTIRIHLDDTSRDRGPLEVLPGTHTKGRLNRGQIAAIVASQPTTMCTAKAGDVLLMRPLLVHRSLRTSGQQRRVLHLEFSPDALPLPLQWHMSAAIH